MKFTDIFTPSKPTLITEAVRFGNKELNELAPYLNRFKIGVEYEFHVSRSAMGVPEGGDPETEIRYYLNSAQTNPETLVIDYPEINALVNEALSKKGISDEESVSVVQALNHAFITVSSILDVSSVLLDVPDDELSFDDPDIARYKTILDDFYFHLAERRSMVSDYTYSVSSSYKSAFSNLYDSASTLLRIGLGIRVSIDLENALNEAGNGGTYNHSPRLWLASVKRLCEIYERMGVENIIQEVDELNKKLQNAIERPNPFYLNTLTVYPMLADREFFEYILSAAMTELEENPDGYEMDDFETLFTDDYVEFIREDLISDESKFPYKDMIEDILRDGSVDDGGEVVSKPLSYNDTFIFMNEMFEYIQRVGSTSNVTGMHVNISSDINFNPDSFNVLKQIVLMDPDFMQGDPKGSNLKVVKWEERSHQVRNVYGVITPRIIEAAVERFIENGINELEDYISSTIIRDNQKFRSINLKSFLSPDSESTRRIEFRFFGGGGYEYRLDDIQHDINYVMYTMLAGSEPNFLRREYLQNLIRMLNTKSMAFYGKTFDQLVFIVRNDGSLQSLRTR